MKRVKFGKEPFLHAHRYVVVMTRRLKSKRRKRTTLVQRNFVAMNYKDAMRLRDEAPPKSTVFVFNVAHNFREAWEK